MIVRGGHTRGYLKLNCTHLVCDIYRQREELRRDTSAILKWDTKHDRLPGEWRRSRQYAGDIQRVNISCSGIFTNHLEEKMKKCASPAVDRTHDHPFTTPVPSRLS